MVPSSDIATKQMLSSKFVTTRCYTTVVKIKKVLEISFESWWPIQASNWRIQVAQMMKCRSPKQKIINSISLPHPPPPTLINILKYFSFDFSIKCVFTFSGQSGPVECQNRWLWGQIRWPRANGPMQTAYLGDYPPCCGSQNPVSWVVFPVNSW